MAVETRIVKVPLPVDLIHGMDEEIVDGKGGFRTRAELIREAIENLLLEQRYESADAEDVGPVRASGPRLAVVQDGVSAVAHDADGPVVSKESLHEMTKLKAPTPGFVMTARDAAVPTAAQLGIHNRDFPSLWAASCLAEWTAGEPRRVSAFLREVTDRAWQFAERAALYVPDDMRHATALFPTNPLKRQAAERRFQDFAVGVVSYDTDGVLVGRGPLLGWGLCQVDEVEVGGDPLIGLTEAGWALLDQMADISLATPHSRAAAEVFLEHLRQHAYADWRGFVVALEGATLEMNRRDLAALFHEELGGTATVASTNASGYVGRCREWGLLAPELHQGTYALTEFGEEYWAGIEDLPALIDEEGADDE